MVYFVTMLCMTKKTKPEKKPVKKKATKKKLLILLLVVMAVPVILLIRFAADLPSPKTLESEEFPVSTQIFDREGKLLYEISEMSIEEIKKYLHQKSEEFKKKLETLPAASSQKHVANQN